MLFLLLFSVGNLLLTIVTMMLRHRHTLKETVDSEESVLFSFRLLSSYRYQSTVECSVFLDPTHDGELLRMKIKTSMARLL